MLVDFKEHKVLPALLMVIFGFYNCLALGALEMLAASYALLSALILSSLYAAFLVLRQRVIQRYDLLFFFLMLLVFAVSLIEDVDWKNWLFTIFDISLMLFLFEYYSHSIKYLLIGSLIGFSLSIYWGGIDIAMHPEIWINEDSKDVTGFLLGGNYNQIGCRLLCGLVTNILCLKICKWFWINLIALIVASVGILFMVQSMTSLSSILLFLFVCIIPNIKLQRLAMVFIFLGVILFQVFVCFSGKGLENNDFAVWFIVDVLGKDITFTYRTDMWDSALRIIPDSPIWGFGFVDADWYMKNMSSFAIGPHNTVFGVLIYGGIIGLITYMSIILISVYKIFAIADKMSTVLLCSLGVLSIMMLMEVYPLTFVLYLCVLMFYYRQFAKIK